jgi:hypothetical protein
MKRNIHLHFTQNMVLSEEVESPTLGSVNLRSIQLSYESIKLLLIIQPFFNKVKRYLASINDFVNFDRVNQSDMNLIAEQTNDSKVGESSPASISVVPASAISVCKLCPDIFRSKEFCYCVIKF